MGYVVVEGETISVRSVVPPGCEMAALRATPNNPMTTEPCEAGTEGADTEVELATAAPDDSTGAVPDTPAYARIDPTAAGLAPNVHA